MRLIAILDVPSQQWLTYVPGAPDIVQTLGRGQLQPDSVVWIRAGAISEVVETVQATLSYYYCAQGTLAVSIGDGGGFCGAMASGEIVHEGAAACAQEFLWERFRIVGDPRGLTYTCKDTAAPSTGITGTSFSTTATTATGGSSRLATRPRSRSSPTNAHRPGLDEGGPWGYCVAARRSCTCLMSTSTA